MLNVETLTVVDAEQLIKQYRTGSSFFFSSPRQTLLTQGEYTRLSYHTGSESKSLSQRAAELLEAAKRAGRTQSIVVGAIPFHTDKPAHLFIPGTVEMYDGLRFLSGSAPERPQISNYQVQPVPEPEQFKQGVNRLLELFQEGVLQKAVLSRTLHISLPQPLQIPQLLAHLAFYHSHGYTFAVPLVPEQSSSSKLGSVSIGSESSRTLVGASPELLVTKKGLQITTNPLAGSAARSNDPIEDERRAAALLASTKDRYEHAIVIEAVANALAPYCSKLQVPSEPSLVQTKAMWHLSTEINGVLKDESITSLDLALAMHPTPAICGTPTDLARDVIQEIEPFDRGFYTGAVGWMDENGDGEWAVTIRCADTEGLSMKVYAGAGIVAGSSAESELAETSAKFRTMLAAMGLSE